MGFIEEIWMPTSMYIHKSGLLGRREAEEARCCCVAASLALRSLHRAPTALPPRSHQPAPQRAPAARTPCGLTASQMCSMFGLLMWARARGREDNKDLRGELELRG